MSEQFNRNAQFMWHLISKKCWCCFNIRYLVWEYFVNNRKWNVFADNSSQLNQLNISAETGTQQSKKLGEVSIRWNVKYMTMIIKIGQWIVEWPLNMIIVWWIVLNDKWVERWKWGGLTSGQKDGNLGKIVTMKNNMRKLTIIKYTKVKSVNWI